MTKQSTDPERPEPDQPHDSKSPDPDAAEESGRRSPALIATAVALPIALIVGIIVAAVLTNRHTDSGPVALGSVPAPQAGSPLCTGLIGALPEDLGDYHRAELVQPAPPASAAWSPSSGDGAAITLRCGLDRPDEFTQGTALQVVDDVQWFEVSGKAQGLNATTWYAVDRGVYVALTLPDGTGPTPIQDVSTAIAKTMPAKPIDPAPAPTATPAPAATPAPGHP